MKIKINSSVPLLGNAPGSIVEITTNSNGVPHDRYWRDRLRDSITDGCVEVIAEDAAPETPTETEEYAS